MVEKKKSEIVSLEDITAEEAKLLKNIRKQHMTSEEMKEFSKGLKYKARKQNNLYDHSRRSNKFKFALIGDTHFGNKSTNKEALNDFYNLCKREGITEVYHTGDLVDGLHVHRGQEYELYALGMEQQAEDIIDTYPQTA